MMEILVLKAARGVVNGRVKGGREELLLPGRSSNFFTNFLRLASLSLFLSFYFFRSLFVSLSFFIARDTSCSYNFL